MGRDRESVAVRGCRSRLCPRSWEQGSVPGAGHCLSACLIEIIMSSELKRKLLAILPLLSAEQGLNNMERSFLT